MDWTLVLVAAFAAVPATVAALASFLAASRSRQGVVRLEHGVNSRMDQLLETTREVATAVEKERGEEEARQQPPKDRR